MKDMLKAVVAAAVVVSMVSCSSEADFDNTNTTDSNKQESVATPINFGSYLAQSKSNLSRAGETTRGSETTSASSASSASEMTTEELKSKGFGVVAYYTGTTSYSAGQSTTEPNFMYNTRVSGTGTGWTYSPVMYWPNGGQTEGATPGEGTQYLSFFAYAPYKETFGDKGITALSSNSTVGDPTVSYTLGATGADADLLWGTAGENGNTTSGAKQNGTTFSGAKAAVNANLSKMKVDGKVKFDFKHALAKFGGTGAMGSDNKASGLMVVADIDNGTATTGGTLDGSTKITVKSIKIESVKSGDDGKMTTEASIPTSGTLNLATGVWTTNNNGKIDYEINSPSATAANEATVQTMNESIAEPKTFESWDKLPAGVSTTAQSVYTETTPLLLIPDGNEHTLRISIDYIVRTKNASLHKGYTEVEQSFYKDLTLKSVSFNAKYNLLIHLGLTSVKFDATVSDWTNTIAGGTTSGTASDPATATDPIVIYMPQNVAAN